VIFNSDNFNIKDKIAIETPELIKTLPKNQGIEAFGVTANNEILAISEGFIDDNFGQNLHHCFLLTMNNELTHTSSFKHLYYSSSPGYDVSGLTFLSNGSALVLERKYQAKYKAIAEDYWIKVKYVPKNIINNLRNSDVIEGIEIISIDNVSSNYKYPLADNFEAIAAKEFDDNIAVLMLSDDNRAAFGRTLLLQFDLDKSFFTNDSPNSTIEMD
jgi:hypothetical protein